MTADDPWCSRKEKQHQQPDRRKDNQRTRIPTGAARGRVE
jgi:hypothetical protein